VAEESTARPIRGVNRPLQARSAATYARILDAAEKLLCDRDLDSLRIEDLIEEAGVSIGSFYARFDGKEAILGALFERYREDLERFTAQRPPTGGRGLEAACRWFVTQRVRRFRRRRGMLRALTMETRRRPDLAVEARAQARRVTDWCVAFFSACADEIGHRDKRGAIAHGVYFVHAICRDRILFGSSPHASTVRLSTTGLQKELAELLYRYLRGS
jgi:AcrR family transcriptional regulator